jgi:hypothetical protein
MDRLSLILGDSAALKRVGGRKSVGGSLWAGRLWAGRERNRRNFTTRDSRIWGCGSKPRVTAGAERDPGGLPAFFDAHAGGRSSFRFQLRLIGRGKQGEHDGQLSVATVHGILFGERRSCPPQPPPLALVVGVAPQGAVGEPPAHGRGLQCLYPADAPPPSFATQARSLLRRQRLGRSSSRSSRAHRARRAHCRRLALCRPSTCRSRHPPA